MSHERKLEKLNKLKVIYRRGPITDKPTHVYEWGRFYESGTHECYELFRSRAKITTYKSLKWHLLVIWYLNPKMEQTDFNRVASIIINKTNGFVTFDMSTWHYEKMIYDVLISDLEKPPKNKLRKIIFNEFTGLTLNEKLSIVGQLVGRSSRVDEELIYQCMLDLNEMGKKITIGRIAGLLDCSTRTIYRNMPKELKTEKELLNKQLYEEI